MSDPPRRFVQQCLAVVDGTFMDILQQNPLFSSVRTGRTVSMNMSDQVIPEMILIHLFSIYFIGHYNDSDLRPKIDSYDVSNFLLMAQVMQDLGVLITSSTKMTRLVRQSKYGGSASFTYLHFQIKYGNNYMLSTHDDLDDHVQCVVQVPDNSKSASTVDAFAKEDNVIVRTDKLVSASSPYESVSTPLTKSSNRSQRSGSPTLGGIGSTSGSHSGSYSLKSSYDIHTLPNTKAEACLWSGTSILTCDKYLSVKEGRISQHTLVRNNFDSHPTNNLYTMVLALMMIHYPYKTDLNFYKIDVGKKEIMLNDKLKVDHFPRLYNVTQCLYEHTIALYNHYSNSGTPYYHLYQVLAKGSDLEGDAKLLWQSQLNSATLSLVNDDIVNQILQSQIVQFFQMRDIMELIMDLIVYRVLLFDKLKTKQSVRMELKQKVLVSQHPGVHYDGILSLVLKAIHYSKVFIGEGSAVQDIVDTLVANVAQTSTNHLQLAMDLRSKLKSLIMTKRLEYRERLQGMDLNDETLLVFS
jgi:hypothetical protein